MNLTSSIYPINQFKEDNCILTSDLFGSSKTKNELFRIYLLYQLHQLLCEVYQNLIQTQLDINNHIIPECYAMDRKLIQFIIRDLIESEEYSLEGIAYHTHIPFDVVFDAACGNNVNLSITSWIKIIELYIQIKPEFSRMVFKKLKKLLNENSLNLLLLLGE